MTNILFTAVLAGLGYIIIKFIEPYGDYKKIVGEIAKALSYYGNVSGSDTKELQDEAHNVFLQNATRLRTSADQIAYSYYQPLASKAYELTTLRQTIFGVVGKKNRSGAPE